MIRKKVAEFDQLRVAYRLDALLHTMRDVARHEEQLCSAMHAIRSQRSIDADMRQELLNLLNNLPTQACEEDRSAILDALDVAVPASLPRPPRAKKSPPEPAASTPRKTIKAESKLRRAGANRVAPRPATTARGRTAPEPATTERASTSARKRQSSARA